MLGVQRAGLHLLLLDDVADRELGGVEAILNQNAYAEPALYARFRPAPYLLTGSTHTLLRREFLQRLDAHTHTRADTGTRVLVTMGGADPANVTQQVMRALVLASKYPLEVRIIVGAANPNLAALRKELPILEAIHRTEILVNPPNVPEQMVWSDVTISAAGSSCWELFCLGVPTIVLQTSDDQKFMSPWIAKHGVAEIMGIAGQLRPQELAVQLETLLADPARRAHLSRTASSVIDGRGAERVIDFVLSRS
jgi:spore coat polysaccharide biosynthesis predicted glycosyltransferase SpsG